MQGIVALPGPRTNPDPPTSIVPSTLTSPKGKDERRAAADESQGEGWTNDQLADDDHENFRLTRVAVLRHAHHGHGHVARRDGVGLEERVDDVAVDADQVNRIADGVDDGLRHVGRS
jgi:hypothetical protein